MDEQERKEYEEEQEAVPAHAPVGGQSPYIIPVSIVIAGALIAGAVLYANRGASAPGATKNVEVAAVPRVLAPQDALKKLADEGPSLGDPHAPVTIIEFADFQCPFCGRFFQTVEPGIMERYVKTGKARFVLRDFAFLGNESGWAANAAACAGEQGKFWQYHDYLFSHQQGENEGAFSKANLKTFARAIAGIDGKKFDICVDADAHMAQVQASTEAGRALGVNGTPATFINGRMVGGAQPLAQFVAVIEEELKKSSR